jgi:molybdopterin molybdotransferase
MALLAVELALAAILSDAAPLEAEMAPVAQALGRVLAEPLAARRTQPPFDASAMDGYAVRSADVARLPAQLRIVGHSVAGERFPGRVGPGEAVRIFTGAPVPEGADAIVIQENTEAVGETVSVRDGLAPPGRFIRPAGLDFRESDVLLAPGTRLAPRHLALAAAMNHAFLPVRRKPSVVVLATGDELVPPGAEPSLDQIIASNGVAIGAMAEAAGGRVHDQGIAPDRIERLEAMLEEAVALRPEVIVTMGGASVGEHDLVRQALVAQGFALDFWRIAMRPGKPLMFGRKGGVRLLGLPGNPVSSLVCARVFLVPLLNALTGAGAEAARQTARLATALPANDERQDYLRARLGPDGLAEIFARQDSSILSTLARSDCLVIRPPHAPAAAAGEQVEILALDF